MSGRFKKYATIVFASLLFFLIAFFIIDYLQEPKSLSKYREGLKDETFIQLSKGLTRYELNIIDTSEIVLFIHGGGILGYEVFRKNIDALNEAGISTLAYDQYGKGYSDKPHIDYTSEELYGQLVELLDKLNLQGKKVNLVSLSLGSKLAWMYLKDNPNLVSKNIFISPSLFGSLEPNKMLKIPGINNLLMTFYWRPQYIKKRRREFYNLNSYHEYVEHITHFSSFKGFKRVYLSTWINIMSEGIETKEINNSEKELLTKSSYIFGDHDPFFGVGYRESVRGKFPATVINTIDNCGHMPNYENPFGINSILINFLSD